MQQSDSAVEVHMGLSICLFSRPLHLAPSGAKCILYPAQKKLEEEKMHKYWLFCWFDFCFQLSEVKAQWAVV